jgi:hypothetical protein
MGDFGSAWSVSEPNTLDRLTIRPVGDLRISGKSACVSATTAKKFVSKVFLTTSGFTVDVVFAPPFSKSASSRRTPALLTRMSSLP